MEEAQWFYEDFIRPLDPALPSLSLKAFALRIFQHCPLMSQWSHYHHITAFSEFLAYKTRVPVRGAILLNSDMDEVVLVKGWKKGANWSFPRGKINKDEKDLDCAIREVYEETGYDVHEAGLVKDEKDVKFIEITMREQHMRLYVFRGVPRDAHFEPRTRKEISKIEWYKLSELPTLKRSKQQDQGFAVANANKFYMVAPFMHPLKKWIAQQKKLDTKTHAGTKQALQMEAEMSMDESLAPNLMTPNQAPVEMATPSTLPEVTPQDASVHLKRLLNINAAAASQDPASLVTPPQASGPDPSKSNALLELLRSGSSAAPAPPVSSSHEQISPPHVTAGAAPLQHPSYPAAPLFPGFPQQDQYYGQFDKLPQIPTSSPHGPMPHLPPATAPQMNPRTPPGVIPQGFTMTPGGSLAVRQDIPLAQRPHPAQPFPQAGFPPTLPMAPPTQGHAPAPYQRTGDPQFSQQARPTQLQGATVPPASKLPPPKLTSHSLALLNVFKDESTRSPKTPKATLASTTVTTAVGGRKPSIHQDQLLGLLKGSPTAPAASVAPTPDPVELSAHAVSPIRKQILQRPRDSTPLAKSSPAPSTFTPKQSSKKSQNGSNRKAHKERKPQNPASPITILPRPQSAKKEPTPAAVAATQSSRNSSRSRPDQNTRTPEPSKPFQPQILRRSENLDNILPIRTKGTPDPDQNSSGPESKLQEDFARRPSQTTTQRETLLSLFGKAGASPGSSPSEQLNIQTAVPKTSNGSSVVSPLSPLNQPAATTNPTAASLDINTSRVASPDNKAFLLGFLEGVAKGNK